MPKRARQPPKKKAINRNLDGQITGGRGFRPDR